MGEFVLKVAPILDLYALYSTVVENIIFVGTREQMRTYLATPTQTRSAASLGDIDESLDRATVTGTSVWHGRPPTGSFDDPYLDIADHDQLGFCVLRRSRLPAYIDAVLAEDASAARTLLEPRYPEDQPGDRLFGVKLPGAAAVDDEQYVEWYRELRQDTALLVMFVLTKASVAPELLRDPSGWKGLITRCDDLSRKFFDHELCAGDVSAGVLRIVDEFNLLAAGTKRPAVAESFGLDEALEIVEEALRGRWPQPQGATS